MVCALWLRAVLGAAGFLGAVVLDLAAFFAGLRLGAAAGAADFVEDLNLAIGLSRNRVELRNITLMLRGFLRMFALSRVAGLVIFHVSGDPDNRA